MGHTTLCVCVLVALCLSVDSAMVKPITPLEVPQGFVEPEYSGKENPTLSKYETIFTSPPEFIDMGPPPAFHALPRTPPAPFAASDEDTAKLMRFRAVASAHPMSSHSSASRSSAGADPSLFSPAHLAGIQTPMIPGPWFGSYATRMDEMGFSIPPYAFDPANFQRLGPYRALTNKYSDGTSYPMNMGKYDYFPMGGNPGLFGSGGAPVAGGGAFGGGGGAAFAGGGGAAPPPPPPPPGP